MGSEGLTDRTCREESGWGVGHKGEKWALEPVGTCKPHYSVLSSY